MAIGANERGGGGMKFLLIIATVLYIVYAAVMIAGAKSADANLKAKAEEAMKFATQQFEDAKILRYKLGKVARDSNLPLKEEDFLVEDDAKEWHIKYAYKRDIKLLFYTHTYDVTFDKRTPKQ